MIFVIGSGPAGVACAAALLERGATVTLLDAGIELDSQRQLLLHEIQQDWNEDKIQHLKHTLDARNPIKKVYNSNFVYDDTDQPFQLTMDEKIHCLPTLASGGLSNAWGAVVGKYDARQLANWPISPAQLEPYYQQILRILSPATAWRPQNSEHNYYHPSQQAQKIYQHLQQHQNNHTDQHLNFDYTELAVKFKNKNTPSCRYCGNCQHGCPIDLIYSAKHTLQELIKNPRLIYIKNIIVENINESADKITLHAMQRLTKQKIIYHATQVFCACGPIASTALALKSARLTNQTVRLRDSTHFMLPCLMQARVKNTTVEQLHTLSQLFLKLHHPEIAKHSIHLQIYTYMDHYNEQLKKVLKSSYKIFKPITQSFLDRLIVIQGYLDSQESHHIELNVNQQNKIELNAQINPDVKIIMRNLLKYLRKNAPSLGIKPIPLMLKMSKIGKSFHFGGSLPMSTNPSELTTDILGRLPASKRLHIVDAAIFPTIPAGSITTTIMANAYRIANESILL